LRKILLAGAISILSFTFAHASIVAGTGNPGGSFENVQYQNASPGSTTLVTATNAGTSVTFTGLENLTTFGGGQARISGEDNTLTYLSWTLTDSNEHYRRSAFIVNPTRSGGASSVDIFAGALLVCDNCAIPSNGFFNVIASGPDWLQTITVQANGGDLADIRQVRLDGVENIQAVPEPATWAMMIVGFAGVGFIAYGRKARRTLTA
jgi:hypothetical protein